jgi:hypothetical protein
MQPRSPQVCGSDSCGVSFVSDTVHIAAVGFLCTQLWVR